MSQFHPRAGQIFLPLQNMTPEQVVGETVTIPAGAAGTIVNFYIEKKPILDSHNCFVGGFGDTSLALTSTAFTTEVSPTTEDADMTNGQYWVDYVTGKGRGKKADNSVSMTADYYVFTGLGGGGGGGGAPTDARYVTLTANGTLTQERVLTGTSNQITITDNGAGSTVVLSLPQNIHTAATPTFAKMLIGSTASFTDFSGAQMVVSQANSGETHVYNVGLVGEGVASAIDTNIWGVGLYGVGLTNSATRSAGLIGDGKVTASADTGSAIGVRGYATDTHAGGLNIGLYGEASGGLSNYALYMNAGDILSIVAQTWTLIDNNASALSFDATGKTGILKIVTTDASEGITMSGTLGVTGGTTLSTVSQSNLTTWSAGAAITAGSYQIGRDTDATNQLHFNVPTGSGFEFSVNDVARWLVSGSGFTMTPLAQTSGTGYGMLYTAAAHTGLTASTENTDVNFNLARTVEFAAGAHALQRFFRIQGPTVAAVSATNFASLSNVEIESLNAGTNATFTGFANALRVGSSITMPSVASLQYAAIRVPAHTITITGSTTVTTTPSHAGVSIGALTVTDASAVTLTQLAGLHVASPIAAGSVTATNIWGINNEGNFLSSGNSTIFGDGTVTGTTGNMILTRSGASSVSFRIQNGNSGFTTSDGFEINLSATSVVSLLNRESGNLTLGTSGNIRLTIDSVGRQAVAIGASSSGVTSELAFTSAAHTGQTAGTEMISINWNLTAILTHASNTAITTQRDFLIQPRTHAFASATGTITNAASFAISGSPIAGTNAIITNSYSLWVQAGSSLFAGRLLQSQGADVASANDLTLGADGNTFEITGTTQINAITTTGWSLGSLVTLIFTSTPTVKHNTAGGANTSVLLLAGAVDFSATAGDTLTLRYSEQGGTNAWREIGRAVI